MAALSAQDRFDILKQIGSDLSAARAPFNLSRPDLLAAINAADDWIDSNASAFNLALPVAARAGLTAKQKAMLLAYVITRRYNVV